MNKQTKNKIFVGNLAWEVTAEMLKPLFATHGDVANVYIAMDEYTGRSRGFGFVEMQTPEAAAEAMEKLNNLPLLGRNLRLSPAHERAPRSETPFRGGGREERGGGGDRGDRGGDRGDRGGGDRGERREYRGGGNSRFSGPRGG